jgi:type VI protein secretion system component Hcp
MIDAAKARQLSNKATRIMAIDVYLQIDGIKGESQDSAHQGWIELTSAHWGVVQPRSATVSTGGGHTAERCEHRSLSLCKLADLASPILMQTASWVRPSRKPSWSSCGRMETASL